MKSNDRAAEGTTGEVFGSLFLGLAVLVGSGALGVGAAGQVPADGMAMGLGVVLGALATIPLTLAISAAGQVAERQPAVAVTATPQRAQPPYPLVGGYVQQPLVLINPSAWQASTLPAYAPARIEATPSAGAQRLPRVVGDLGT